MTAPLTPEDLRHLAAICTAQGCDRPLRHDNRSGYCYRCPAPKRVRSGPVSHVGTKVCSSCQSELPRPEFAINRTCLDLQQAHCRTCRSSQCSDYRATFSEEKRAEVALRSRDSRLRREYGITLEDWDDTWAQQDESCAMCRTVDPGAYGQFVVDHCHETGEFRGIVCHHCNLSLGYLEAGWSLPGFKELVSDYLNGVRRD